MVAREAFNTSDNVGMPLVEGQSILSAFIPDMSDLLSMRILFDKRFFKLFFIGIGISGILTLCTIGSHRYYTADRTDWSSMYNTGRSLIWTRNYDEAEKCFQAALSVPYIDNAERSSAYGELARLAERRGDSQSAREYSLKESQYSQFWVGMVTILIASMILFVITISSILVLRKDREKVAGSWYQPVAVAVATFAVSNGIHQVAPSVPWFTLTMIAGLITFVVLVFSAACDGSRHPHFVTPSRD